ncbi:MAG: ParB N-terminal domain-containing protein [Myxacorys chilensis ATA2-1-KO14]|jgi:ParB family chromosome partitioning protein|nr:ParB N-terminal domain-containing protein [Myxacorys chilensis ATA2-1-KO14]
MANRLAAALQNIGSMMPTADLDNLPAPKTEKNGSEAVIRLRLSDIEISDRVRQSHDEVLVRSFVETFRSSGFRGVLWVRPTASGKYKLIAGGTRYLACQQAKIEWVDALVFEVDAAEALDLELEENLKRRDFNDLETVHGILRSLELELSLSREQVIALFSWNSRNRQSDGTHRPPRKDSLLATIPLEQLEAYWAIVERKFERLGRYRPEGFRVNFLPLLNLPQSIQTAIMQGHLEGSKARLLARITDEEAREALLEQAIAGGWSRDQITEAVKTWREEQSPESADQAEPFSSRVKSVMQRLSKASLTGRSRTKAERLLKELEALLDA